MTIENPKQNDFHELVSSGLRYAQLLDAFTAKLAAEAQKQHASKERAAVALDVSVRTIDRRLAAGRALQLSPELGAPFEKLARKVLAEKMSYNAALEFARQGLAVAAIEIAGNKTAAALRLSVGRNLIFTLTSPSRRNA